MTEEIPNSAPTGRQSWRELYRAVMFETTDKQNLCPRIALAERALILRARELFATSRDNDEEGQAIDDALYALRALRKLLATEDPEAA